MNLITVAARNALRNKFRTILTVLGAAIAVLMFVALRTVIVAWNIGVDYAAKDRLGTRHKVSFILPLPKRYIAEVAAVPGVKQTCAANWFGGKNPKDPNDFFATLAIENSCMDVFDEMVLDPGVREAYVADKKGALVGDVLAKKLGVKVGDRVTLTGTIYPGDWQFNVVGIYKAARKSLDRSQFFFHWEYLNDSLPPNRQDQVGWISTRIDNPSRSADISAAIDKLFDEKDTQTTTMSEKAMNLSFMGMLSAVLTAINVISGVMLVLMMLILGNTIAMGVRERTREYGVLRAIGFSPGHIGLFIVGEAMTLGLLAGVAGLAIAYPIVEKGIGRVLEENMGAFFPYFQIDVGTMIAAVVLSVALSVVAALIPAYRASKLSVTDALRQVA